MKFSISYHDGSLSDFQDGLYYYDDIATSLADRFQEKFWEKIEIIKENPLQFQVRYANVRVALVSGFPFSIHFIFNGYHIEVLRVLHTKRNY